jgi:hypothetical protein
MIRAELDCPYDDKAVSVLEATHPFTKRAYLMREYAKDIQSILAADPPVLAEASLIVTQKATVKSYDKGPEHNCTLYLDVTENNLQSVESTLVANSNIYYTQNVIIP